MDIIAISTEIDDHLRDLEICLQECANDYGNAETHAIRNIAFDRFTAMVGDGYRPRSGLHDWRKVGVKGYRPLVIKCLGHVYKLAQTKLLLSELLDPGRGANAPGAGTDLDESAIIDMNLTNYVVSTSTVSESKTDRWTFIWDGEDILMKLLHRYNMYCYFYCLLCISYGCIYV